MPAGTRRGVASPVRVGHICIKPTVLPSGDATGRERLLHRSKADTAVPRICSQGHGFHGCIHASRSAATSSKVRRYRPQAPHASRCILATVYTITSVYFGSSSISRACRFRRSQAISVDPEPPNRSKTQSPPLLLFTSARSIKLDGLHGRMEAVRRRLLLLPQRRLRLVAVPGVVLPGDVAVEDRLVLELVATEAPGEGVLGPDDLAAYLEPRRFQSVLKFPLHGRGVANIQRRAWFHRGSIIGECTAQESIKLLWVHPVALDLQLVRGVAFVIDVVRRVGEDEVRRLALP